MYVHAAHTVHMQAGMHMQTHTLAYMYMHAYKDTRVYLYIPYTHARMHTNTHTNR